MEWYLWITSEDEKGSMWLMRMYWLVWSLSMVMEYGVENILR